MAKFVCIELPIPILIQNRPTSCFARILALISAIHTISFALLWSALLGIALPALESTVYASRLAAMPVPAQLALPLRNIPASALRDSWHAARSGGRRHEGIDIFAAKGVPVYASTEGIVLRRGQNRLGGNVIWVLGPGGQKHYYAHLDRFTHVSVGERVQRGSLLGFVGNTGNARKTPPHLHYGVYTRSGAINPFPLFISADS